MEALEGKTRWICTGCGVDITACLCAVPFHCGQDADLEIGCDGEHEDGQRHLDGIEPPTGYGAVAPEDPSGDEEERPADGTDTVQHHERAADYKAGLVGAGEDMKGYWCEHERKEEQAADPGDHGEKADCAEGEGHA